MLYDLMLVFNLVVILYIWFETEAFVEWAALFRLKCLKYNEFQANKKNPSPIFSSQTYPQFLETNYGPKSFFVRMITCPTCFSVWCNIALLCVFHSKVVILWFGPNVLLTWLGYALLRWILLKVNNA